MKKHLLSTIFGTVLAVGAVASFGQTQSASAMTLPITLDNNASGSIETALPITKVRNKHKRAHRRYNRRRHGQRFRSRRGGHRHYYNGFWYAAPFWLGATTYYRDPYYAPRRGSRHVRWCLNRYRSYRLSTDTFRGYDGYDHLCRSPYRR